MKQRRVEILEQGIDLTTGDRNETYGTPYNNLTTYAELCQAYLRGKPEIGTDVTLDAVDGAIFMVLAKVSRVAVNKFHADNYVDMATYSAIAGEVAELVKGETEDEYE